MSLVFSFDGEEGLSRSFVIFMLDRGEGFVFDFREAVCFFRLLEDREEK